MRKKAVTKKKDRQTEGRKDRKEKGCQKDRQDKVLKLTMRMSIKSQQAYQ